MERLTNRDREIPLPKPENAVFWASVHEKLAQYEDAEDAGRLPLLPCAIGDKIFRIEKGKGVRILASHVVEKIEIGSSGMWLCFGWRNMGYETVRASEIGKTIFLTPKEGQAALKGDSNGSNV